MGRTMRRFIGRGGGLVWGDKGRKTGREGGSSKGNEEGQDEGTSGLEELEKDEKGGGGGGSKRHVAKEQAQWQGNKGTGRIKK